MSTENKSVQSASATPAKPPVTTTVADLIKALQQMNPDAIVMTNAFGGDTTEFYPIRLPITSEPGYINMVTGQYNGDDEENPPVDSVKGEIVTLYADS